MIAVAVTPASAPPGAHGDSDGIGGLTGLALDFLNRPPVWFSLKILLALLLFWIGIRVGKWAANFERRLLLRAHVDQILAEFLRNVTYVAILALLIVSALELSGFPTTSLLTTLGAAGLAIGLALKDSLSHIAAGVVLIVLRPFRVGDTVNIGGHDGVVEGIFIFQTRLHTLDNRQLTFMNGQVIAAPIFNYSDCESRRNDINLLLAHDADMKKVFELTRAAVAADSRILKQPAPTLAVGDINDKGIAFQVQVWTTSADMGGMRSDLLTKLQTEFAANGIGLVRNYAGSTVPAAH